MSDLKMQCRVRHGRVVTNAVRAPVRPATPWMHVLAKASVSVIAGRRVVSRRARLDMPGTAAPAALACASR